MKTSKRLPFDEEAIARAAEAISPQGSKCTRTLVRVAVQFAREHAAHAMSIAEIVARAERLTDAAFEARRACEQGKKPDKHYAAAQKVLAEFGAQLVARGDVNGCVVGAKFSSGTFKSGFEDIFYVA